jgi:hypothetical protein
MTVGHNNNLPVKKLSTYLSTVKAKQTPFSPDAGGGPDGNRMQLILFIFLKWRRWRKGN